jgi:hypothetical protein
MIIFHSNRKIRSSRGPDLGSRRVDQSSDSNTRDQNRLIADVVRRVGIDEVLDVKEMIGHSQVSPIGVMSL